MKKLIPTVCLALMGAAAVTGSTYAWFSMNKSVEATGMKVKATTSGALVIGTSITTENDIAVDFAETTANVLSHSTHITSGTDVYTKEEQEADEASANPRGIVEGEDYITGLKTLASDDIEVNPSTGVIIGEEDYIEAVNPGGSYAYYQDYEFYIAAAGQEMDDTKIVMSMTDAMKADVERNWGYNKSAATAGMADTLFGFTVDVYSKGVVTSEDDDTTDFEFVSSYHLDDENATLAVFTGTVPTTVTDDETPLAQGIHYMVRVYLDGAYGKKTCAMNVASGTADGKTVYFTKTGDNYVPATVAKGDSVAGLYTVGSLSASTGKYVHTDKANTTDLDLGFKFEAVDVA